MRVHHIALRTRKLAALERFYRAAFGLRRAGVQRDARGVRSVWLRAGEVVLMMERAEPRERRLARGTLELVCFGVATRAAWQKARRRIERLARIEGETLATFYFRDPEGRRVGVSCYRF